MTMETTTLQAAVAGQIPLAVVARSANLEAWAVEKLATEAEIAGFAAGGAWSVEMVQALARAVDKRGFVLMAHSLRVLARQSAETPARSLPLGKPATAALWYLKENA